MKQKKTIPKKRKSSQWPLKRDILWRPERREYVLKKNDGDCVFCAARAAGSSPTSLVLTLRKYAMIVLNKYPYNTGHLLLLPLRHIGDIAELSKEESDEVHGLIREAVVALRKAYSKSPEGFNIGANLGSAAGAGIPSHLHYHIVPRWVGDSNFFPILGQVKCLTETLEQTYKRLLPYF